MASFTFRLRDLAAAQEQDYSWLAPDLPPPQAGTQSADVDENGWLVSSFELRRGLRVSEAPIDTLPGELREALLSPRPDKR